MKQIPALICLVVFSLFISSALPLTLFAGESKGKVRETEKKKEKKEKEDSRKKPIEIPINVPPTNVTTQNIYNIQDFGTLKDFYMKNGSPDTWQAELSQTAALINFSHEVLVIVASKLQDSCTETDIVSVKRLKGNRIKMTIASLLIKPCQPVALDNPFVFIGTVINRPVSEVEVVYTDKLY